MLRTCLVLVLACAATPLAAAAAPPPNPQIDYDGYRALIEEVQPYRRAG